MVPIAYYLVLAAVLFCIGIAAFLIKRNVITIFMSIELMLNAVNLTFVAFAHMWHQVSGQIFVFFVMVVAAAEAAVGLAIIIALFRVRQTLNVDQVRSTQELVFAFLSVIPSGNLLLAFRFSNLAYESSTALAHPDPSLRRLPAQRNHRPQAPPRPRRDHRSALHPGPGVNRQSISGST